MVLLVRTGVGVEKLVLDLIFVGLVWNVSAHTKRERMLYFYNAEY